MALSQISHLVPSRVGSAPPERTGARCFQLWASGRQSSGLGSDLPMERTSKYEILSIFGGKSMTTWEKWENHWKMIEHENQ
jgi:hypothetical protein